MRRKAYSAGMMSYAFWFIEYRKIVHLLAQGQTIDEIRELNKRQNLFSAVSQNRSQRMCNILLSRIQSLDNSFISLFESIDLSSKKQIALISTMADDSLFFDFVYEVIREKMIIGNCELTQSDIRIFFKNKQEQDETVARWADSTCTKLGQVYKSVLCEAGMLNQGKGTRKIYRQIIDPELENWLTSHDMEIMAKALTGVR